MTKRLINEDHRMRKLAGLVDKVDLRNPDGYDSVNLYNEMAVQEPATVDKMEAGLNWIEEHGINCVLIGGTAVVHYVTGARRSLTPDLDFLTDEMPKVLRLLDEEQLKYKFLTDINITRFGNASIGVQVFQFDLDFLDADNGNSPFNHYIMDTAITANVGGRQTKVINPAVLTISKLDIGRDKDDNDAFLLLQSGKVTRDEYKKAYKNLKKYVADPESVKMYASMIKKAGQPNDQTEYPTS